MPRNSNVGSFSNMAAGLVLQSKKPIDATLWGAEETTLEYVLRNDRYPDLVPALGAIPGDVTPTVDLRAFAHLGKETHRFIHSGKSPGIGTLQVKYRGAIIGDSGTTTPEQTDVYSLLGFSVPYVYADATNSDTNTPSTRSLSYRAPGRQFRYVSRFKPDVPVFATKGPVPGVPATLTFTAAFEIFTASAAHGFVVGDQLRFYNGDGDVRNLPDPLSSVYPAYYYVTEVPTTTTFKVRSAFYLGGGTDENPVNVTSSGTGTHYVALYAPTSPTFDETDVAIPYTVTLPDGRIYTYTSRWVLIEFRVVVCGRFFEVTESDTAKIIETITHT